MKQPKSLNEWANDLLSKINTDDATTSQICMFMLGLNLRDNGKIKSIELTWEEYAKHTAFWTLKPKIKIEYK
jgi:hypothetical protein